MRIDNQTEDIKAHRRARRENRLHAGKKLTTKVIPDQRYKKKNTGRIF